MAGGLIGNWKITSFKELAKSPDLQGQGDREFNGCLDLGHDGSCAGDPTGTLSFRFLYWGKFGAGDSLVWGSCWHPVTGGSGDFAGAEGVLTMVDTPTAKGVRPATPATSRSVGGGRSAAPRRSSRLHCG